MFSMRQKRDIAEAVQQLLRTTRHPELPASEIQFLLHVRGASPLSWASIRNNGAVKDPGLNPWNEVQDPMGQPDEGAAQYRAATTLAEAETAARAAGTAARAGTVAAEAETAARAARAAEAGADDADLSE